MMVKSTVCKKCNKSTKLEFCNGCFLDVIYKRLRKHIRANQYIKRNDHLLVKDELTKKIFPSILNTPVTIKFKGKLLPRYKEILTICLDDIEELYLDKLFHGKSFKMKFSKQQIPLYICLTKEELQRLAKFHKIKLPKRKKTLISEFLDYFEKQVPGTKFNIKKSILS
ncbi:hypothetical protein HOC35_00620 [Candidatus Woesearchaeota archaeon]|jgi:hypothetical protein|nr:hypothetical protein [Candidatus Woesearchaeota archaeon]